MISFILALAAIACFVGALICRNKRDALKASVQIKAPRYNYQGMRICADCQWFSAHPRDVGLSLCFSPRRDVDLVSGTLKTSYCSVMRRFDSACGEKGKWFEPNETEDQDLKEPIPQLPHSKNA